MKCIIEIKQGALSFDVENSIASLLGFRKILYKPGKYTSQKFIGFTGFSAINIHCKVISEVKDSGNNTEILYTFTLTEPSGYLINIKPTNILYQSVTKDRMEYIEFHIKDKRGRPIDFNGDVLSFTLQLIRQSHSHKYRLRLKLRFRLTHRLILTHRLRFSHRLRLTHRMTIRLKLRLRLRLSYNFRHTLILRLKYY